MNLPAFKVLQHSTDGLNQHLRVQIELTEDLDYFDGHFDDMLILPAVAQLDMVKRIASQYWEIETGFSGLQRLKFKAPVWPKEALELFLEYNFETLQLKFQYIVKDQLKSQGTFLFGAPK